MAKQEDQERASQEKIRIARSKEIADKLVEIGNRIIRELEKYENPAVSIPVRSLSNVYYDEKARLIRQGNNKSDRTYFNVAQSKSFMQTMLMASKLRDLLEQGSTVGLRQLFYMCRGGIPGTNENTFDEQEESDPIVEDVEGMLDALREEMNVYADRKGILCGDLKIVDHGDEIDCSKLGSSGYGIPSIVEKGRVDFVDCKADYILIVEKAQTWSRLNEDKFWKKNKCLILTGKGQPARGDRRLAARLHKELDLPVYVFTDMDIWGYYIYSVYKQGSINLAHFSEKSAMPDAKFLGFMTRDVKKYDIPKNYWIPLDNEDHKRVKEISNYEWFKNKKEWLTEFKSLLDFKNKVEQDALVGKGIEFMAKKYLPEKIESKDWFD
ncbi:Type 2 DNA topoisomerase 6 subunit A [Candidatus Tiddalikarchaeum anstoanum]|nr:Type 2 DNA topoisomerase 6 subunit A [Candidatus Tiddalikarchaeum anstoanum]